ncbi:tetratricopeptide repeat protein [Croceicoccus sp. F390]|uniref:Tetratricopeptide repeat protein n=1 Tax=Croceicoccus esteveae TaxID=3075597 RepID=A0ABU2ZMD0_9SPHN|nr:tetratricopeptide repeat protein [Croceicoccus sp. F390]MDT0576587.1 tetratricopeptide repeat protein [Croceicoccus sp. F390]
MGLILAVALGLASFAIMVLVLKLPRRLWEVTGAAIVIGLAGYAAQGSPGFAGSPGAIRETVTTDLDGAVELRKALGGGEISGSAFLITADALARRGQFGTAAGLLRGAIRQSPDDADLWLALGNALVGHTDGVITPAALLAYKRAAEIAPDHPGPPFFTGLALAQSGRFADARAIWAELLAKPGDADAAWKADLASRVKQLDMILALQRQGSAQAQGQEQEQALEPLQSPGPKQASPIQAPAAPPPR